MKRGTEQSSARLRKRGTRQEDGKKTSVTLRPEEGNKTIISETETGRGEQGNYQPD